MKIYLRHGAFGTAIEEDKTEWCCGVFKLNKHEPVFDDDMYLGDCPDYIFNFDKLWFEKVTNSAMFGNGGFGDRFWGDEELKRCPYCGKELKLTFNINGGDYSSRKSAKQALKK